MTNKLKTPEVVTALAEALNTSKKDAKVIYDTVFSTLADLVIENQAGVPLGALGAINVADVAERDHAVRNMETGEQTGTVTKPAHKAPRYKASKGFKEALKG